MTMRALLAGLLAALVGALALLVGSWGLPDLDVRALWFRVSVGHTQAASPPGQLVRCERDGLHRVDMAVTDIYGTAPQDLELVVRDGGPTGEVLRRAPGAGFRPLDSGGWLRFDLERIADSGGRALHLSLLPAGEAASSHVAAMTRLRGVVDGLRPWGEQVFEGPLIEDELVSRQPDLRGLSVYFRELEGRVALVLYDADSGRELRRSEAEARAPVLDGWVALGFEPLADSRWKRYRYRLALPPGARLVGPPEGPTLAAWHGSGEVDERLGTMTLGDRALPERDLLLRAWTTSGPGLAFARLGERLGWRLLPLVVAWLAASALIGRLLPRRRP